jgi:hypothetical protein
MFICARFGAVNTLLYVEATDGAYADLPAAPMKVRVRGLKQHDQLNSQDANQDGAPDEIPPEKAGKLARADRVNILEAQNVLHASIGHLKYAVSLIWPSTQAIEPLAVPMIQSSEMSCATSHLAKFSGSVRRRTKSRRIRSVWKTLRRSVLAAKASSLEPPNNL